MSCYNNLYDLINNSKTEIKIVIDINRSGLAFDQDLFVKALINYKNKNKEIKPRCIIKVTREHIDYCKELIKVIDLHHLEKIKGDFILSDKEYIFAFTDTTANNNSLKENAKRKHYNSHHHFICETNKKIITQQHNIFETLWHSSIDAKEKIKAIEEIYKEENKENRNLSELKELSNDDQTSNDNSIEIIKRRKDIESLLLLDIYNSKTEAVLAIGSCKQVEYFYKIGLNKCIKHVAATHNSKIIILYPQDQEKEFENNKYFKMITSIENVHCKSIVGLIESILITDNSKILIINDDNMSKDFIDSDNECNKNILGIHSENKSIIRNFGSLLDMLSNERSMLNSMISTTNQLKNSNKQLLESNQKLEKNSKIQKDFINLAAHEIRTPIQAISGCVEVLEMDLSNTLHDNGITHNQYFRAIVRNTQRLEKLVENLLDISKIESNAMYLKKEKIDLNELINTIIHNIKDDLKNKEKMRAELDTSRPYLKNNNNNNIYPRQKHLGQIKPIEIFLLSHEKSKDSSLENIVMIDKDKITQVFCNLINNSLNSIYNKNKRSNYNLDNDQIKISILPIMSDNKKNMHDVYNPLLGKIRKTKHGLLINIKDTGEGIDSEIIPKLFEKFTTNSSSGTGLGLYIAKSIIEAHGGKIWAENNKDERGANLSFTLPLI